MFGRTRSDSGGVATDCRSTRPAGRPPSPGAFVVIHTRPRTSPAKPFTSMAQLTAHRATRTRSRTASRLCEGISRRCVHRLPIWWKCRKPSRYFGKHLLSA